MFIALVFRLSGQGPSPGLGHCDDCVLGCDTLL